MRGSKCLHAERERLRAIEGRNIDSRGDIARLKQRGISIDRERETERKTKQKWEQKMRAGSVWVGEKGDRGREKNFQWLPERTR